MTSTETARPAGSPADLPADARVWLERASTDQPTPWDDLGLVWSTDGAPGEPFRHSYLSAQELEANADLAANVRAISETAALAHWLFETDDGEVIGYWRGPDSAPLDQAPLVQYDTEGQFSLVGASSVTEWLAEEVVEYGDGDLDEIAEACREAGVSAELRDVSEWTDPEVTVTPARFHQERYQAHLDTAGS